MIVLDFDVTNVIRYTWKNVNGRTSDFLNGELGVRIFFVLKRQKIRMKIKVVKLYRIFVN